MKSALFTVLLLLMAMPSWALNAYIRIDGGENVTGLADVTVSSTAVLIKASNSYRASLSCTTTANVRWGDSTITTTKGQLVPANAGVEIRNTAAVYMIAESGDAVVSC